MSDFISKSLLKEKAAEFGVELDEKALDRFDIYARLLVEWNEKINLTAITDLDITLMDSTNKKLNVIRDILENIGLDANVVHKRAEEAGQSKDYREHYDFATARAVSNLRDLSEFCLPFVKVGGTFISLKSAKADEEIEEGKKAISVLGGKIKEKKTFPLDTAGERTIILIEKFSSTPGKYPRPSAKMAKNPIR